MLVLIIKVMNTKANLTTKFKLTLYEALSASFNFNLLIMAFQYER